MSCLLRLTSVASFLLLVRFLRALRALERRDASTVSPGEQPPGGGTHRIVAGGRRDAGARRHLLRRLRREVHFDRDQFARLGEPEGSLPGEYVLSVRFQ